MGAQFEGQAAVAMAAARAKVAADIEAAGGREAYLAQTAEAGKRAAAKRRVVEARAAVAAAEQALIKAQRAEKSAELTAEGKWVVLSGNGAVEGYGSPELAARGAEWFRAGRIGAHVVRPYCGHAWNDRLTAADGVCRPCAKPSH